MSNTPRIPFFARFIETESPTLDTNVRAGEDGGGITYPIKWPPEQTKKYSSDYEDTKWPG